MILSSALEIKSFLLDIDKHISKSSYKVEYIVKELGMTTPTYYRKLKDRRFDVDEVIKILQLIYPDEFAKQYLKIQLNESIKEANNGETFPIEDMFTRYRKKYIK